MKLPKQLTKILDLSEVSLPDMGYSGDQVYLIKHGYLNKDIVIKCSNREEVYKEGLIFEWLQNKIKVPEIYFNLKIEDTYYLIMEMLPGQMGQYGFEQLGVKEMVIYYANLIKEWHQIDYSDFLNVNTLQDKLNHAKYNVEHNLVKTQYFERELREKTGEEVYTLMMNSYPKTFDLVLCHGDVCMPNFMMSNGKLTGWIDVVGCGVNDRYLDIAIALRTLRFNFEWMNLNFSEEYQQLFLETYGISDLDLEKVKFYICLDELTNG